ncbi:hypothetical protein M976_01934 [Buttiauxella ferragutiae ATCC 51602]|uniref:FlgN family flagellar biosynthesis protein n=1 Tax=Buttiauxella ferragutiae ATCC 51602 TaxID=1354252 RepID=A0ABX2W8V7_9ENTR|nr:MULTISPECIES: flagellar protein FlgN [Buttiauxella]OAT28095.1 hypothetical protein M976_01934 [Buttiauxella ferragutiae ATCC 51602]TDN49799.1 flagellar biosynthesis/type III secretory pathway chaperone [Buttiauxella sp. JUb87]
MSNANARVRQLIVDIHQDVVSYQQMELLLKEQNSNLIRRNNPAIKHNNEQQVQLLHTLRMRANQRVQLLHSFGLQANSDDLKRLACKLPTAISDKMMAQWQQLEASVIRCKKLNDHNGRLLANQQLLIRKLLNTEENFYQPAT